MGEIMRAYRPSGFALYLRLMAAFALPACSSSVAPPAPDTGSEPTLEPTADATKAEPMGRAPADVEPDRSEPPTDEPSDAPDEADGQWDIVEAASPLDGPRIMIAAEPDYQFSPHQQIVGDLDGDGIDDIVAIAVKVSDDPGNIDFASREAAAYVFYGREDFLDAAVATDAQAVLRGAGIGLPFPSATTSAAGDFDGDGLDDLAIGGIDAAYVIFGSEERLAGEYALADVASTWEFGPLPDVGSPDVESFTGVFPVQLVSAGDVQGDGLSDLLLTRVAGWKELEVSGGSGRSPTVTTYLILGGGDVWTSGTFDATWGTAAFEDPDSLNGVSGLGAADLDGDGYSDVLLKTDEVTRVVPGAAEPPTGTIRAEAAGTPFPMDAQLVRRLDDLNGDGIDDLAWSPRATGAGVRLRYGGEAPPPEAPPEPHVELFGEALSPQTIAVADFDGDGENELLMAGGLNGGSQAGLYLLDFDELQPEIDLPNLAPTLRWGSSDSPPDYRQGRFPVGLNAGGDVNGDGMADILVVTGVVRDDPEDSMSELVLILGRARP